MQAFCTLFEKPILYSRQNSFHKLGALCAVLGVSALIAATPAAAQTCPRSVTFNQGAVDPYFDEFPQNSEYGSEEIPISEDAVPNLQRNLAFPFPLLADLGDVNGNTSHDILTVTRGVSVLPNPSAGGALNPIPWFRPANGASYTIQVLDPVVKNSAGAVPSVLWGATLPYQHSAWSYFQRPYGSPYQMCLTEPTATTVDDEDSITPTAHYDETPDTITGMINSCANKAESSDLNSVVGNQSCSSTYTGDSSCGTSRFGLSYADLFRDRYGKFFSELRVTFADTLNADFNGDGVNDFAVGTRCKMSDDVSSSVGYRGYFRSRLNRGCCFEPGSLTVFSGKTGQPLYTYKPDRKELGYRPPWFYFWFSRYGYTYSNYSRFYWSWYWRYWNVWNFTMMCDGKWGNTQGFSAAAGDTDGDGQPELIIGDPELNRVLVKKLTISGTTATATDVEYYKPRESQYRTDYEAPSACMANYDNLLAPEEFCPRDRSSATCKVINEEPDDSCDSSVDPSCSDDWRSGGTNINLFDILYGYNPLYQNKTVRPSLGQSVIVLQDHLTDANRSLIGTVAKPTGARVAIPRFPDEVKQRQKLPPLVIAADPRFSLIDSPYAGMVFAFLPNNQYKCDRNLTSQIMHLFAYGIGNGFNGYALKNLGDIDGDLYDDFLMGTPGDMTLIGNEGGHTMAISGRTMQAISFQNTLAEDQSEPFDGDGQLSQFGLSADGGQDINGDGYRDIIIGSPGDMSRNGLARLYSGFDQSILAEFSGDSQNRYGQGVVTLDSGRVVVADLKGNFQIFQMRHDPKTEGSALACADPGVTDELANLLGDMYHQARVTEKLLAKVKLVAQMLSSSDREDNYASVVRGVRNELRSTISEIKLRLGSDSAGIELEAYLDRISALDARSLPSELRFDRATAAQKRKIIKQMLADLLAVIEQPNPEEGVNRLMNLIETNRTALTENVSSQFSLAARPELKQALLNQLTALNRLITVNFSTVNLASSNNSIVRNVQKFNRQIARTKRLTVEYAWPADMR